MRLIYWKSKPIQLNTLDVPKFYHKKSWARYKMDPMVNNVTDTFLCIINHAINHMIIFVVDNMVGPTSFVVKFWNYLVHAEGVHLEQFGLSIGEPYYGFHLVVAQENFWASWIHFRFI